MKNGTLRVPSLPCSPPVTEPLKTPAFCAVTAELSHTSLRRRSARIPDALVIPPLLSTRNIAHNRAHARLHFSNHAIW